MPAPESFTADELRDLRARYVLDRYDGKPILAGHADCPRCAERLTLEPLGRMEFGAAGLRVALRVRCPKCRRIVEIADDFSWGP